MAKKKRQLQKLPITKWWHVEGKKVICDLCPRNCELSEGQRGFCFVRQNLGGEMQLTTYGKSTGFCIDPIEKKPLNHFLPGTPVLSFGTAGCNLGCKFCQNWDISKSKEIEILSSVATPEAIVAEALKNECKSIAFTYNDPIIWAEYAIDTAKVCHSAGIKTVAVTSGYLNKKARSDFFKYMDAANVDLKAFSEKFYKNVTLSKLQPVLDTLKWLKEESNTWFEITNLIIPEENDSDDELKRMCEWIVENLGRDVPIHFTAFHPDYKMLNKIRTPTESLLKARNYALEAGIQYAYVGNVHHAEAQNTYCPGCNKKVIERDWYELGEYSIRDGKCKFCSTEIAGVFSNTVGDWGSKRLPVLIETNEINAEVVNLENEDNLNMSKKGNSKSKKKSKKEKLNKDISKRGANSEPRPKLKTQQDEVKNIHPANSLAYAPRTEFLESEKKEILLYVENIIRSVLTNTDPSYKLSQELFDVPAYGAFVTLKRGSILRGCRGRWGNDEPLILGQLLSDIARDTALSDPRFPAIKLSELDFLTIEISLMYDPEYVNEQGESRLGAFEIGKHGLVTISEEGRGLLLPNVATENNWDAKTFIEQTCLKANLNKDAWLLNNVSLLKYKTVKFDLLPTCAELGIDNLSPQIIGQLFQFIDVVENKEERELQVSKEVIEVFNSQFGIQLETQTGHRAIRFGVNKSMLELLREAITMIEDLRDSEYSHDDKIDKISILSQPIELFAEDYPYRLGTIVNSALLAQVDNQATLTFPGPDRGADPISFTFNSAGVTAEDWSTQRAQISAFQIKKVGRRIQQSNTKYRSPVFAGKFYPADEVQMNDFVDKLLNIYSEIKQFYPALMLPHAGWKYCGSVIAKTLAGVSLPPEVIIIGPKHTDMGANFSLANQEFWEIPGSRIPIINQYHQFLIERVPGLVSDIEAHRNEHGVEVLLPFLKKIQPELRILPIAVGSLSGLELANMSKAIAELYVAHLAATKRPIQIIISSDMNHYAPEEENRRRDQLALQALQTGDFMNLLKVCSEEQISMCGALPAVIVMQALKHVFNTFSANIVAYQTSAAVTGDIESVVGYAGVRFGVNH